MKTIAQPNAATGDPDERLYQTRLPERLIRKLRSAAAAEGMKPGPMLAKILDEYFATADAKTQRKAS